MAIAGADPAWFLASRLSGLAYSLEFQTDVLAAIVLLVLVQLYRPRAGLVWSLGHGSDFTLPGSGRKPARILTRTLYLANQGLAPAEHIEVRLSAQPTHVELSPPIEHRLEPQADGTCALIAPSLGPRQRLTLEVLQLGGSAPEILSVNGDHRPAVAVAMAPTALRSRRWRIAWAVLAGIGAFYALKLAFTLIVLVAL